MNKKNFIFILSVFFLFLSELNGPLKAANASYDSQVFPRESVDVRGLWDVTTDRIASGDDYPYYASFSGDLSSGLFLGFNRVDLEEKLMGDYSIQGNEITIGFDVRKAYLTIMDENHMSGIWRLGDGSLGGTVSAERIPWPVTTDCDVRGVWEFGVYVRDRDTIGSFNAVFSGNIDSGISVLTSTDHKFEGGIFDYTINGVGIYMADRNEGIICTGTIINDDFLYGTYTDPETSGGIWAALRISLPEMDPPFGSFETPFEGSILASSVPLTGWALDDSGVENVKIYFEQDSALLYLGNTVFIEGARPDIAAAFPNYPNNTKAGWGYMLLTNFLPNNGNGAFVIHAIATDLQGKTTTLGIKTIYCDNASAVKPFGAIDTPTQGGTATGSSFINWGWALTPLPNIIPTNGSTIDVYVDGVKIGHPTYNIYRSDIASLFPGYANSNGAAGYFSLDTTGYANGVHTILWTAVDSGGNMDGIGSRYFSIWNSGSSRGQSTNCSTQKTNLLKELAPLPAHRTEPLRLKSRPGKGGASQEFVPDPNGMDKIGIKELEPLEILLGENISDMQGYLVMDNRWRDLPVGSTLDIKTSKLYWSPGPGFIGKYHIVFVIKDSYGRFYEKSVEIDIEPKFNGKR